MRRKTNRGSFSDINITPLVDVMLVLLVIFMVTTPMLVKGIRVNLPKTKSGQTKIEKKNVIISIDKNGHYYLDKVLITQDALEDFLKAHKDKSVIIKSDKDVRYGLVIHLIDMVKSAGISKVGLATQPRQ
ncbi:ExbD/TolR family protein [Hippea maritima]|uniref:Biopolymer transport protein ExbD/TolR n=1 Tax=Hippea maritima (strain ATCC 700847 / DSM 10411 / MH2) TaxID=760142 RepID=F2LW23_HIPMA|nr:biopolymer transporter ExbD [Hippea maritima]AEA33957.1 Biopolymer transport protein ExbD/TolR [Hippea maritima DSM 10411]